MTTTPVGYFRDIVGQCKVLLSTVFCDAVHVADKHVDSYWDP